jgi:hypothetical protein
MAVEKSLVMPRRKFYQVVFALAGLYNISWGVYAVIDPQWFFRFIEMPPINYAAIFACLGMVIGLYGCLYLYVAHRPEGKSAIVLVGLTGKILGPLGMIYLIVTGVWPWKAAYLCLTNDVIWLIPFIMYLVDARSSKMSSSTEERCDP